MDKYLNKKIFDKDVEQVPIRNGFGDGLLELGDINENVVGLCCDLTESTKMNFFAEKYPERFIQMGVAEQSMASVASGMSAMGKIPFMSSYAMFSPGRNWEQIRTTICYNNNNVKIIGSHAGVSVGPDGGTHQAIEDIAIARVIPNIIVISPCDAIEARKATHAIARYNGPAYLRLAREATPIITTEDASFEIGKAFVAYKPGKESEKRVGIIATGALVYNAILASRELEDKGIYAPVLNLSTIKPLDKQAIIALAEECGKIVTVEEHQVAGGMGSAVAELLAVRKQVPMRFIGVSDKFGQSGTPDELITNYGMDIGSIVSVSRDLLR